jgi:D-amino peptidase
VAMRLLTKEVNAAVDGILDYDKGSQVVVMDGHGSGGIDVELIHPAAELIFGRGMKAPTGLDETFDALFFVGQHAMAGTANAPLCHTYSSRTVEYYKLNGEPIGEFAGRAYMAGHFGVPTAFLAGDDKACVEAAALVPGIVTVATKLGMGIELANHLSPKASRAAIRKGARKGCKAAGRVAPAVLDPPYELEVRVLEGQSMKGYLNRGADELDERTCVFRTDDYLSLPV